MERALAEPGLGYYATSTERPTRDGDFLTAPELHPFFGRCLGRHLADSWTDLGRPSRFTVREWGAGHGALAEAVQAGLAADGSPLAGRLEWQPVDLAGRHPVAPTGPVVGVVLANELLDALPVHRLARLDGRLVELFVAWRDGWFVEEPGPPSTPALGARLRDEGVELAEGQRAEVSLAAIDWLARAAGELERGWLLVIDYGHPAAELYGRRRLAGSLVTYRDHRAGDDPFVAIGRQDITAHVDLTAIGAAAEAAGLLPAGHWRQADFLAGLGLGELLYDLGRRPDTDAPAYLLARSAVARLLDPRHLGGFHVLRWSRGLVEVASDAGARAIGPAGAQPPPG